LKEEKEGEKVYIRSLKNVLVVLEEIFYMRSMIFFLENFAIFKPEKSDFDICKGLYVYMLKWLKFSRI